MVLIVSSKIYYKWRNAHREKIWRSMSEADRARYLETTTDKGNKRCVAALKPAVTIPDANPNAERLDFRFVH